MSVYLGTLNIEKEEEKMMWGITELKTRSGCRLDSGYWFDLDIDGIMTSMRNMH